MPYIRIRNVTGRDVVAVPGVPPIPKHSEVTAYIEHTSELERVQKVLSGLRAKKILQYQVYDSDEHIDDVVELATVQDVRDALTYTPPSTGGGGGGGNRDDAYAAQGVSPVNLGTDAKLDIVTAGKSWEIRDRNHAEVLTVTEGSASNTTTVKVGSATDVLDVNSADVDFSSGVSVATGSVPIDIGQTPGVVETTTSDLTLRSAGILKFDDASRPASGWSGPIHLADNNSEWDAYRNLLGETSILNAITGAYSTSNVGILVNCLPGDTVGACVRISAPKSGGRYTVTTADITNYSVGIALGVLTYKTSSTEGFVLLRGIVGLYTGLTPGKTGNIALSGQITTTVPTPSVNQTIYVQKMGWAVDTNEFLVSPSPTVTIIRG